MTKARPILLIENNPTDAKCIMGILGTLETNRPLVHLNIYEQAYVYLNARENTKPWLILLGLNGENADGLNLLKTIKTNESLKQIPVVIIATSEKRHNVAESYKLGAAGYAVKPSDISDMAKTLQIIIRYWSAQCLPVEK